MKDKNGYDPSPLGDKINIGFSFLVKKSEIGKIQIKRKMEFLREENRRNEAFFHGRKRSCQDCRASLQLPGTQGKRQFGG